MSDEELNNIDLMITVASAVIIVFWGMVCLSTM